MDIQNGASRRKQKRNGKKPRMSNAPETHSPFQIANCLCWSSFTSISHFNVIIPDSPSAFSSFLLPVPLIVLQYEYAKSNRLCSNPFSMISLLKRPHIACKFILHMQSSSSNHLLQTRSSAHLNFAVPILGICAHPISRLGNLGSVCMAIVNYVNAFSNFLVPSVISLFGSPQRALFWCCLSYV